MPRKRKVVKRRRYNNNYGNKRTGGFMGIELKFYDTSLVLSALNSDTDAANGEKDPTSGGLSTIGQGDGESNRDGRRATFKSIYVTGNIHIANQPNQTGPDVACTIFIALVLDTQTNGAQLSSESVYNNPASNVLTGASLLRNLQQIKRFRVLKTKTILMPMIQAVYDGTNIEQYGCERLFKLFHTFKGTTIANYSGTTESIANSTDNSLHLLAWTTNGTYNPSISYNSRLRFMG